MHLISITLLMKDDYKNDSGGLTGEWGAGVFATSEDCIHRDLHPTPCPILAA
ncbi:hypothetical protein [Paenibacillus phytorum]|uniref:hypothetical protein n=1 Tax=Paenibacillus phytorum TaxID=2654977 RepID=UPI0014925D8A|nr:hypothetical protein [Paenibacillus phytorum]